MTSYKLSLLDWDDISRPLVQNGTITADEADEVLEVLANLRGAELGFTDPPSPGELARASDTLGRAGLVTTADPPAPGLDAEIDRMVAQPYT